MFKRWFRRHTFYWKYGCCKDWSFAGDIADAIINIALDNKPEDYVIGSGIGHSINQMVSQVFSYFDLDYTKHTIVDDSLLREGDPEVNITMLNLK